MSPWFWFFLAAAIINGVLIYAFRKHPNHWPRIAFAVAMLISFFNLAKIASDRDEAEESVWQEGAIEWEKGPVSVHYDDVAFAAYREPIEEAMTTWESRIGCPTFEKAISKETAQIRIRGFDGTSCGKEVPEGKDTPMRAHYCGSYFDIQVKRLDHIGLAYRMFLHDFGHALGLTHDEVGAMAPKVREARDGDYPEHLLPSNKDVAALRERLCH